MSYLPGRRLSHARRTSWEDVAESERRRLHPEPLSPSLVERFAALLLTAYFTGGVLAWVMLS